jgi:hypothetical protein
MATVTGVVEVAMNPNKFGKFAMLVDEVWYSTDPSWLPTKPEKGDTVTFDNGGKKYIKNLTITGKGGLGKTHSPAAKGGYSNLGVELGHASNVAKDMANKFYKDADIGSEDWYIYWMEHTQKVYKVMGKLRKKFEEPEEEKVVVMEKKAEPASISELDDIFS